MSGTQKLSLKWKKKQESTHKGEQGGDHEGGDVGALAATAAVDDGDEGLEGEEIASGQEVGEAEKQGGNLCSRSRMEHFHSLVTDCEFMDLEFKGPSYTWSNNQEGESNIRIRLDRALATVDWRNLFPLAQVIHETRVGSDHCPLLVMFKVHLKRVPFQFKFESKWSTHPECGQVVSRAWDETQSGSALYGLVQKMKRCKRELLK
ncbi:hypothetical protein RHGRI_034100 [Rhododendron griersonianum]|uniref:Uncharacterized protein n=1 Tax=Rhododendron griersonianum TaxID=479676 RepID=A0AAV6I2I9_9ERIC|nr:hypothetical protein RHGRI_034100 [Rhododendron griersonianum]